MKKDMVKILAALSLLFGVALIVLITGVPREGEALIGTELEPMDWNFAPHMLDAAYVDVPYLVQVPGAIVSTVTYNTSGVEGKVGQHVAVLRSTDDGATWGAPIDLEPASPPESSWAMPWYDSASGALYVFYTYNYENVRSIPKNDGSASTPRVDVVGAVAYKTSLDGGITWSERSLIQLPKSIIDLKNPFGGEKIVFWLFGYPVWHGDFLYLGLAKAGPYTASSLQETESFILRLAVGPNGIGKATILPGGADFEKQTCPVGYVTKVDPVKYAPKVSVFWSAQSNPLYKNIARGATVKIGSETHTIVTGTGVGSIYLAEGTFVPVGAPVYLHSDESGAFRCPDGYVRTVDTTVFPDRVTAYWTNQSLPEFKTLKAKDLVRVGAKTYNQTNNTGVGSLYLPLSAKDEIAVGMPVFVPNGPLPLPLAEGIKAPVPFWNTASGPVVATEEPSVLIDDDGTIHIVARTDRGRLMEAWSTDGGITFTSDWARQNDGYLTVYHPRGPATMFPLPDGRILLWTYNNNASDFKGRNPVWYRIGTRFGERIRWGAPHALAYDQDINTRIGYASFLVSGDELLVAASDKSSARLMRFPLANF